MFFMYISICILVIFALYVARSFWPIELFIFIKISLFEKTHTELDKLDKLDSVYRDAALSFM